MKTPLELLDDLNKTLTVPAAEYVPAIPDAWAIIDKLRAALRTASAEPSPEVNVEARIDRQLRNFQKHDPSLDRELLDEAAKTNAVLADRAAQVEARGLPPLPAGFTPWMTGTRGNPDLYSAYNVRLMIAAAQADARREDAEMLDWLETRLRAQVFCLAKTWYWRLDYNQPHHKAKSLRDAIRASMNTTKGAEQ